MIEELIEQVLEGEHSKDIINNLLEGKRATISKIPPNKLDAEFDYQEDEDEPGDYDVIYTGEVGNQDNSFGNFDNEGDAKEEVKRLNKLLAKRRKEVKIARKAIKGKFNR
jgi:hypothetical protein